MATTIWAMTGEKYITATSCTLHFAYFTLKHILVIAVEKEKSFYTK